MSIARPFPDQLAIANECIARQEREIKRLRNDNSDLYGQLLDKCRAENEVFVIGSLKQRVRDLERKNGDLRDQVQAFDACKSDRAFLRQNVKDQAEHILDIESQLAVRCLRIAALEGEVERLTARPIVRHVEQKPFVFEDDPGQYDLPVTRAEDAEYDAEYPRIKERDLPPARAEMDENEAKLDNEDPTP